MDDGVTGGIDQEPSSYNQEMGDRTKNLVTTMWFVILSMFGFLFAYFSIDHHSLNGWKQIERDPFRRESHLFFRHVFGGDIKSDMGLYRSLVIP